MNSVHSKRIERKASRESVDLAALAAQVAPLVLARLASALGAAQAPFSTRRGHEPPEYAGRPKRWRADAPKIPGAVRVGRWVSVPRASYAAWLDSQSMTAAPPAANHSQPWSPATALASAGLRPQRGTR